MPHKETQNLQINTEQELNPGEKKRREMSEQGYSHIDNMQAWSKEKLTNGIEKTEKPKDLIINYYFGERFCHAEAYLLCAVGKTWPTFALHPEDSEYVMNYTSLNSATSTTNAHVEFEGYFEYNRMHITQRAAESLNISLDLT